jgi:hypothetical protein
MPATVQNNSISTGNKIALSIVGCVFLLIIGFCVYVLNKPVYCPAHNLAMTDTGKLIERPLMSGHTYKVYHCPQGHEWEVDQCPSCSEEGDSEFQRKQIDRR